MFEDPKALTSTDWQKNHVEVVKVNRRNFGLRNYLHTELNFGFDYEGH